MDNQTKRKTAMSLYRADMKRYGGKARFWNKRFHFYLRLSQCTKNRFLKLFFKYRTIRIGEKHGVELRPDTQIGKGLYLGHPYGITVNLGAKIGENCNLHKGVTIGQENRGPRKGSPVIGDRVWIGINATVVGNITVGDDVLIAPNSYVNCDVPAHSVVFGNPCTIKHRENATENYINKMA